MNNKTTMRGPKKNGVFDTRKQELPSVHEVADFFLYTEHVSPFIQEGDKEPSWDGSLYLYYSNLRTQTNCYGKISVQVKGEDVQSLTTSNSITYQVRVSDLKAYLKEGTAYFVVQVAGYKQTKIFYHLFHPIEIKKILAKKGGKVKRSIQFDAMPVDFKIMDAAMIEFWANCKKQISYVDGNILQFEDLKVRPIKKINFVAAGYDNSIGFQDFLTRKDIYIYAETDDNLRNSVPIGSHPVRFAFTRDINEPVSVNGVTYFDSYKNTLDRDFITLSVGDCFTISFKKDLKGETNVNFHTKLTNLKDVIHQCSFIMDILKYKGLTFGTQFIHINYSAQDIVDDLSRKLPLWKAIQESLDKLGVNTPLDLSKINEQDGRILDALMLSVLGQRPVAVEGVQNGILDLKVANLRLLLSAYPVGDDNYLLDTFFSKNVRLHTKPEETGEIYESCIFSMLGISGYLVYDNIDYINCTSFYEDVRDNNPYIYEYANFDLLSMIGAVDQMRLETDRHKKTMQMAKSLANWIYSNDSDSNNKLNHHINILQLKKREQLMDDNDRKYLRVQLKETSNSSAIKAAICLLLDNQEMFEMYYDQMSPEDQKAFDDYPICKWRKKLY